MSIAAMKAIQMVYANTTKHDWPDDIWDAICKAIEPEKQQLTNVVNSSIHAVSGEKTGENHDFHHSGIEQKPLASDGSDGSGYKKAIDDVKKAYGITSDMKQEYVDKTAKQRHKENA